MRELHPNRGPHDPRPELPLLKAGSVRRTTTIDTNRPHGIAGIAVVDARSRDMRVGEPSDESSQRALATAQLQATVDYIDGRRLLSVDILPQRDLRASSAIRS